MQKKETFGAEQVKEVKLLEEKSHQYGIKLQSLLQVCGFLYILYFWIFNHHP